MQEWHLILNDGYELIITCKNAEITKNGLGEVTNIHWNGIKDNVPIKLDLKAHAVVTETDADEEEIAQFRYGVKKIDGKVEDE